MIKLTVQQTTSIKQHTLECYPEEMCGVLIEGDFIPLANTADDPEKSFKLNEMDLFPYLEKIGAVVHSHCQDSKKPTMFDVRTPSIADVIGQELSRVPWLIVGTEGINVTSPVEFPRQPNNDYLERPFMWFINDCYTLVQDYYKFELGIELPAHPKDKDYNDLRQYSRLITDYIEQFKFEQTDSLDDIKNGDLVLVHNLGSCPNHIGIYHNGDVIHQDMMSVKLPLTAFIGRIHKVLKYVG